MNGTFDMGVKVYCVDSKWNKDLGQVATDKIKQIFVNELYIQKILNWHQTLAALYALRLNTPLRLNLTLR